MPNICRTVPFSALYFGIISQSQDTFKFKVKNIRKIGKLTLWQFEPFYLLYFHTNDSFSVEQQRRFPYLQDEDIINR